MMKNDRDLHTVTGIALQNLSNLLSGPQRLLSIGPRAGQPGKEAGYLHTADHWLGKLTAKNLAKWPSETTN